MHCWQRDTCVDSLILLPPVYNEIIMVLLSLVFWNQRFGRWVLKMFHFCSNYVVRGQLFLLYHIFGTYSFPISSSEFTYPQWRNTQESRTRELGKKQSNSAYLILFPNSFGKERNEEDKILGIWEYFCFVHW